MATEKLCLTLPYTRELDVYNPVIKDSVTSYQCGMIFINFLFHIKGQNYYLVSFYENGTCFHSYHSCYDSDKSPLNFIISEMLQTCSEFNIYIVPSYLYTFI